MVFLIFFPNLTGVQACNRRSYIIDKYIDLYFRTFIVTGGVNMNVSARSKSHSIYLHDQLGNRKRKKRLSK